MIPEYRRRALTTRGLSWAIRLRLLLLLPGTSRWNAWIRDQTARLEGFASYDEEMTDPRIEAT